jgi:hypothetical protein
MYCIDHPTDHSKKDIAFAFIKNNFDHVYLCNDDDLCCPVSSLAAPNPKLSKWHCLLDFLASLRIAGYTSIYPPLSMVHFLEDKYEQRKMLGPATLPYFKVQPPQVQPREADKGRVMWQAYSWETLYISLLGNSNSLAPIPNISLLGIAIKPRFGCAGRGVVILRKVFEPATSTSEDESDEEMEDREYTIEAIMLVGECPDKPSEWLILDSEFPVEFSSFFVELYCPYIAEEEHRIFLTMPQYGNSFTWLYSCPAELDLQGVMSIGPLSIPNRLKQKLQETPSMLRQQLSLVESTVPSLLNGNIYRVDRCMAGELDYEDFLENPWVIN